MFTGLVEEVGKIKAVKASGGGARLVISALKVLEDCKIGDSISINGVCQTVTALGKDHFEVDAVEETVKKTTLGKLKIHEKVNLERSLTLNRRLGGHFVLGHVDATGKILNIRKLQDSYLVSISYPKEFENYIVNVGAIAIDGISLTIARSDDRSFMVSIIPHTWNETSLSDRSVGAEVNLEFDVLGKYVAKILKRDKGTGISEEWLKQNGF
ncbi:MAG: riboflavin synthase [Bacteroidota bacterium]|nr:riboflavin synthase [Bacteroidota bacterium]MDP4190794.1 riboflavin synthase [Bacteroidota bacterium]